MKINLRGRGISPRKRNCVVIERLFGANRQKTNAELLRYIVL
jgi:hypothetical protein